MSLKLSTKFASNFTPVHAPSSVVKNKPVLGKAPVAKFHSGCFSKDTSYFKPGVLSSVETPLNKAAFSCSGPSGSVRFYSSEADPKRKFRTGTWFPLGEFISDIQDAINQNHTAWHNARGDQARDARNDGICNHWGHHREHDWKPRADISQDKESYVIHVELAGVKKEDIKINIEDGVLTLSGQRKAPISEETEDAKFYRQERRYGNFERAFELPTDADASQIKASFKDGVLEVKIAKQVQQKQTVEIKIDN